MWKDLEYGFQAAFEQAWKSYCTISDNGARGLPIGCAVLNGEGVVVSAAHNQIYVKGDGLIAGHQIAHAEINAILHLSEYEEKHKDIRTYTLYTTMEPCPLCFGAIVMGSIKNVKYAARDPFAGAAELADKSRYLINKKIKFEGPFPEAERVSIVLAKCYEFEAQGEEFWEKRASEYLKTFEAVFPGEYAFSKILAKEGTLARFAEKDVPFGEVYDYILNY